jgi:hypothetical protein
VVNHFEAMPGPEQERFWLAKDKLAICPHTDVRTELELYVEMLRDMDAESDLTSVDGNSEAVVCIPASAGPNSTVETLGVQVGS